MNVESTRTYLWMLFGSVVFSLMATLAHGLGYSCDWQLIALFRSAGPFLLVLGLALYGSVQLVFLRPATLWLRSIAGSLSMSARSTVSRGCPSPMCSR